MFGSLGYGGVFVIGAVACVLAAALSRSIPEAGQGAEKDLTVDAQGLWRRFRPFLIVVWATATVEAGAALLILLHLQEQLGLTVYEIAVVYLPGAVIFMTLPAYAPRLTDRLGPPVTISSALLASAAFALTMAFFPHPLAIAALWALSAACWAAAVPVEQSVISAGSGASRGRAMGLYEVSALLGSIFGPLLLGAIYTYYGWEIAFFVAAGVLVTGATMAPLALKMTKPEARV